MKHVGPAGGRFSTLGGGGRGGAVNTVAQDPQGGRDSLQNLPLLRGGRGRRSIPTDPQGDGGERGCRVYTLHIHFSPSWIREKGHTRVFCNIFVHGASVRWDCVGGFNT